MERSPNDPASTPSPTQTGCTTAADCAVAVSGNAVTTRADVTVDSVNDVNVVEGLDTMTGTEVVNVVKLELRESEEEVALAGMREDVDVRVLEAEVNDAEDGEDAEGIAEDGENGDESVREDAGDAVGRKVEPPLVVHQLRWAEMDMEMSSLAVRRSRVVQGMTEGVGGVVMYAQRAGIQE